MAAPPLLLHVFSSFAIGGAQVRFASIANHFGRRWRHAIIAMDGNVSARERLSPALDVTFPTVEIRKRDTLGNLRRFHAALRALRPDVLVTSNFGAIEWALANTFFRARHVHTEDGFGPDEAASQLARRVRLRRLALRRSTVVVPSRTLYKIATEEWRLHPGRVRHVPNGIDLDRFAFRPGRNADLQVIGTVAALRPEKNLSRLLRAFALLPDANDGRLVVVGDGPERGALQAQARSLGIGARVTFAGHTGEPQNAYASFEVFALSSDTEQMPLSVVEAMAIGLPIVATDVGDVRAMVADANHDFVVAPDDAALAAAMSKLLGDTARRVAIGAANRERAERLYGQEAMFKTYAALFDGIACPES